MHLTVGQFRRDLVGRVLALLAGEDVRRLWEVGSGSCSLELRVRQWAYGLHGARVRVDGAAATQRDPAVTLAALRADAVAQFATWGAANEALLEGLLWSGYGRLLTRWELRAWGWTLVDAEVERQAADEWLAASGGQRAGAAAGAAAGATQAGDERTETWRVPPLVEGARVTAPNAAALVVTTVPPLLPEPVVANVAAAAAVPTGAALRARRERLGVSQAALAARLGMKRGGWWYTETEQRDSPALRRRASEVLAGIERERAAPPGGA